jgi:hypothetical protein
MNTSEQTKKIYTKLKFVRSEKSGAYIGFVSQNLQTGRIIGVRQDSKYSKKICIIDKELANFIILDILYDVTLIPMREKNGYIVIEANPVTFKARIETTYIKKVIYKIEVKFGNKSILFDPIDGKKDSVRTIAGVREILEKRMDIQDSQQVIEDFLNTAYLLMKHYENDMGMQSIQQKGKTPQKTEKGSNKSTRRKVVPQYYKAS